MKSFALATLLIAAAAVTARADDTGERTFTVEIAPRDPELREDCSRRLFAWWDEMTAEKAPPAGWDDQKLGPWSLVVRTSGGGFFEERPGLVRVFVNVASQDLRSRSETADAYTRALLDGLSVRVAKLDIERTAAARDPLVREKDETAAALAVALADLRLAEQSGASPERRSDAVADRLSQSERDVATTRIDRAVAAKKLETARSACDRAVEIERLRRDAAAAETEAAALSGEAQSAARSKVSKLRDAIDALSRTTPPLDAARDLAFRLEVDLVGLEAREKALAEEVAALRDEQSRLRDAVRTHGPALRAVEAARARAEAAERKLSEFTSARAARGRLIEVVRAPGPPSPERPSQREDRK